MEKQKLIQPECETVCRNCDYFVSTDVTEKGYGICEVDAPVLISATEWCPAWTLREDDR